MLLRQSSVPFVPWLSVVPWLMLLAQGLRAAPAHTMKSHELFSTPVLFPVAQSSA